jgi:hypothetical protein
MILRTVPMGVADALAHIEKHHSHHHAPCGGKFAVGVSQDDGTGARVVCVAIVGRPVARTRTPAVSASMSPPPR